MYNAALSACEDAERWEEASQLLEAGFVVLSKIGGAVCDFCFGGIEVEERWGKTTTMTPSTAHSVHHGGPMKIWRVYIESAIGFLALVDVRVTFTRKNSFTSFLFLIMRFGHILRRSERDLQCVFTFLWGRPFFGKTQNWMLVTPSTR